MMPEVEVLPDAPDGWGAPGRLSGLAIVFLLVCVATAYRTVAFATRTMAFLFPAYALGWKRFSRES
jgi:hypothetical protein